MEKQKEDDNKKGILAPLLKTLDYLLDKLGYEENSRVRKKLEPVILVVVMVILGLIPIILSYFIDFDIGKVISIYMVTLALIVSGSWIISLINIPEKHKRILGVILFLVIITVACLYILYENRQVIYDLKKEIDTELKKDKNIDTTKLDMTVGKDTISAKDTVYIVNKQDNPKITDPIIETNKFTFTVERARKRVPNADIEVQTPMGIFNGKTNEKGIAVIEISGEIKPNKSYAITVNDTLINSSIKNITNLTLPKTQ